MQLRVWVPVRTYSKMNQRVHWRVAAKRARLERKSAFTVLRATGETAGKLFRFLTVTIIRQGPSNGLDDDNLRGNLKSVRDGVADWLGVDDADPRIRWQYRQTRTALWGVTIIIEDDECTPS
jgi:hypothetical protein